MYSPLVSVIVPCHNYAAYLPEALESALNQTYSAIEVLVVDDDSDDFKACDIAEEYGVGYHRIGHKGARTPAHAHNEGLKVAHGDFVVFLSADDKLNRHYVQECYNKYMRHRNVGFVWTGCREFGDSGNLRLPYKHLLKHSWSAYGNVGGQLGAMLVPRKVYDAVGGYDTTLSGREDWDWTIRCLRAGFIGVSVSKPLHYARVHGSNLTRHAEGDLFQRYPLIHLFNFPIRVRRNVMKAVQNLKT